MAKKDDAYAICTAQKKKSGMGHDAWKRCVAKLKKSTTEAEDRIMTFNKRLIDLLEKKALKTEKMKNVLPSGPKAAPQATRSNNDAEEELDDEDTIFDDCGTKLVAKYRAKKKKNESDTSTRDKMAQDKKDAGFGELDSDDEKAIATGVKKARDEEAARRKAAGLPPHPDINASKKREMKEQDDPSTSDARLARELAAKTRAEREAEGEEFDKDGRRIYPKHPDGDTTDDDDDFDGDEAKKKKGKKEAKVKEGSRPFKPNKPGIGAMSAAERAEKARVPSDDEVARELQRRKDAGKCADGSDPPCDDKPGSKTEAKKGKKDDKWIQKAVDPDHEGYCTPMTKATCTPKRKALAKTFKKMGRARDRKVKAKDEK
jgi:hypothetical protein